MAAENFYGRRHWPATLWAGVGLIAVFEFLLWVDVAQRTSQAPQDLQGPLVATARWVAVNMTALCWPAYLLVCDGVLAAMARRRGQRCISCIRARPNRFVVACLTSILIWCFFDWVNFAFLRAWRYQGLPEHAWQRYPGYFVAFAAIAPGMFLAAQFYQHLGLQRLARGGCALGVCFRARFSSWARRCSCIRFMSASRSAV